VGFERLAETAHIPVIWATQVLETLAKTGIPSRAEVTDAAMGVRAECVMLNKASILSTRYCSSITCCTACRRIS
jgi:pyruvate kinase